MSMFDDVTITWAGVDYTIPANKQMGLIARIEEALTAPDYKRQAISVLLAPEGPSYGRLATAFGSVIRYAGASVTDEEIYLSIMEDVANQNMDLTMKVQGSVISLLSIIAPPIAAKMNAAMTEDIAEKK